MAQRRLRDWFDPLGSFEHNLMNFGLHSPGRYCGFDSVEAPPLTANTRDFQVTHDGTGFKYKDPINTTIGPIGVLITPQGVIVQEDAVVGPFTFDSNAGSAFTRYDAVYFAHDYAIVNGGNNGTYHLLKGSMAAATKPILPDPLKQTLLGYLEIPPGSEDIADCTWHKAKCPDSGDGEDARLNEPNTFKATQQWRLEPTKWQAPDNSYVVAGLTGELYTFPPTGNSYVIEPPVNTPRYLDSIRIKDVPLQEGTRIGVMITSDVTVRELPVFLGDPSLLALGYRPIAIPNGLSNVQVFTANQGGGSNYGIQPEGGEVWELELLYYNGWWRVMKIGGAGAKSQFKRGMTIFWIGDVNLNFDIQGRGINLMAGWQLPNGHDLWPDLRGKSLHMATDVPSAGDINYTPADLTTTAAIIAAGGDPNNYIMGSPYLNYGKKAFKLLQAQLPPVLLPVTDPKHWHFEFSHTDNNVQVANNTYPAREKATGGNSGYNIHGSIDVPTQGKSAPASTGITVHTGGTGTDIDLVQPSYSGVWIVKS